MTRILRVALVAALVLAACSHDSTPQPETLADVQSFCAEAGVVGGDGPSDEYAVVEGFDGVGTVCVGPVVIDGNAIEDSTVQLGADGSLWMWAPILLSGADGVDRFNEAAARCHARDETCPTGTIAIVLDDAVAALPPVTTSTFERDQITISGDQLSQQAIDTLIDRAATDPDSIRFRPVVAVNP